MIAQRPVLWIVALFALVMADLCPQSNAEDTIEFTANSEYMPVDMGHVAVLPGSALDLSALVDVPAGRHGRLVVTEDGLIAPEGRPGEPFRLFGGNGLPFDLWHDGTDEEFRAHAAEFARAFRAQGYNCLRLHGLDNKLMSETEGRGPLELNEKYLDRWDYLISEMKKRGCYFQLVIFSFGLFEPTDTQEAFFRKRRAHKLMMYAGRDFERSRFKDIVTTLLNHVNPYTGLSWKDDPTFAIVEFYNEQYDGLINASGLAGDYPEEHAFFISRWHGFLEKKFPEGSVEPCPPELKDGIENAPLPGGEASEALKNAYADFCVKLITENNDYCRETIRATGYQGILTQNSFPQYLYAAGNWLSLDTTDAHNYFQHPSGGWGRDKGAVVRKSSSAAQAAPLFRGVNAERLSGRPLFVGEFNHCFWNPYQHELPLTFSAYAALNNFSSHVILCDPVWVYIPQKFLRANIFDVGRSPVQRAGEFLSALFFLRGDVTPAPHRIECAVSYEELKEDGLTYSHNAEQGKLGLVTNFSLRFCDLPPFNGMKNAQPDFTLLPSGAERAVSRDWYTEFADGTSIAANLDDAVRRMRESGLIPEENATNPELGVFQSETGEITLRQKESLVKVITPRSEAVSLLADASEHLDALTVLGNSVDSLVGVAAMDGEQIRQSRRLVLVFATRMANQGMKLEADGETLVNLGQAPSLMQTGALHIRLDNLNADELRCFALRLDGHRTREIPLTPLAGGVEIHLDTAALEGDLTPFFELAVE